jgi:hypothetical protein
VDLRLPDITMLKGTVERFVADYASAQDREQVPGGAGGECPVSIGARASLPRFFLLVR